MTVAYLHNGRGILMMNKKSSRLHDGEFWSGLGGHMEAEELNNPRMTCLREIYEESGLDEHDITGLRLKYVLLRIREREIRQQFVYFGTAKRRDVVSSEEGELHWIEEDRVLELNMSAINGFMIEHYLLTPNRKGITVGTITVDAYGEPCMQWAELHDPGVF